MSDPPALDKDRFIEETGSYVSRKVISSGGTEPVADAGTGGHSVFAFYLLKARPENATQVHVLQAVARIPF